MMLMSLLLLSLMSLSCKLLSKLLVVVALVAESMHNHLSWGLDASLNV